MKAWMKTMIRAGCKLIRDDGLPVLVPVVVGAIANKINEKFASKHVNARTEHDEESTNTERDITPRKDTP